MSLAYRAILVDDEYWVMEGLLRIFPWQQYGFEVVEKFVDAGEALDYLKAHPVDLVISDIRMPEFTGLDLLHASRARGDATEFVMISGYAEFAYAQQALRANAFDYCLKPIKPKDAEDVLCRVRNRLDAKRAERERDFAERALERGGVKAVFDMCGEPLDGSHLLCVACQRGDDALPAHVEGGVRCVLLRHDHRQLMMLSGPESALARTRDALASAPPDTLSRVGISRVASLEANAHAIVREADMASYGWFVAPDAPIHLFSDAPNALFAELIKSFELAISRKDADLARRVILRAPTLFQQERLGMFHVQQLWNRVALIASDNEKSRVPDALALRNYEDITADFDTFHQMCQFIARVLAPLDEESDASSGQSSDSFDRLYEYVREHYCEKLTIGELTKKFYLNPTYCCELFKSRTGRTFSEFVTCLRMERASEMMRDGKRPLQDIAQAVGYFDYFYFSKSFKKYFGVSPTRYAKDT